MLDTLNTIIAEMRECLASAPGAGIYGRVQVPRWRFEGWIDRLSALRGEAVAYCPDCQSAGMRNCSDFVNCGNARCVTCKQLLDAPPTPVVSAELREAVRQIDEELMFRSDPGAYRWQTIRAFLREQGVE